MLKIYKYRLEKTFKKLYQLFNWIKFDDIALCIHKKHNKLKITFNPLSISEYLEDVFFENSFCKKVMEENQLLINYTNENSYSENIKLNKLGFKMSLYFPMIVPNKIEGSIILLYKSIKELNLINISENFILNKKLISISLISLFQKYLIEDISNHIYQSKNPYYVYDEFLSSYSRKTHDYDKDVMNKIIQKIEPLENKKIVIEDKIRNEIIHISKDLKKILNINEEKIPKHIEEICNQYEKYKLDFYKKVNLTNAYIPIKFSENNGKYIEFFVHIPENIDDFNKENSHLRFYHFFSKNEIQFEKLNKNTNEDLSTDLKDFIPSKSSKKTENTDTDTDIETVKKEDIFTSLTESTFNMDTKEKKILNDIYQKFNLLDIPREEIQQNIKNLIEQINNEKKNYSESTKPFTAINVKEKVTLKKIYHLEMEKLY